jgi:hypothetical protein
VTAEAPILTEGLLGELEQRWHAQQAPIVRYLQPGISEEEMAELVEPLGMTVPSEVRTWYRWRNGAVETGRGIDREMCGTGWAFFSLQRATQEARERRGLALDVANGDVAEAERILWSSAWLPLAGNYHGGVMFVDSRAQSDPPRTPVHYTEPQMGTQVPPPAPSLGQVITWWIEAIDDGICEYDPVGDRWRYDVDKRDQVDQRADRAAGRRYLV